MLELSDKEFKLTLMCWMKTLDNIQIQMSNISREIEILGKNQNQVLEVKMHESHTSQGKNQWTWKQGNKNVTNWNVKRKRKKKTEHPKTVGQPQESIIYI